jgi:hypothetical protein
MNDNMIFKDTLVDKLTEGYRGKTDTGYRSSAPKYKKCAWAICTEAEQKEVLARLTLQKKTSLESLPLVRMVLPLKEKQ